MELNKYIEEVDDVLDEVTPILEEYRESVKEDSLKWILLGNLIRRIDVIYNTLPDDNSSELEELEEKVEKYNDAMDEIRGIINNI